MTNGDRPTAGGRRLRAGGRPSPLHMRTPWTIADRPGKSSVLNTGMHGGAAQAEKRTCMGGQGTKATVCAEQCSVVRSETPARCGVCPLWHRRAIQAMGWRGDDGWDAPAAPSRVEMLDAAASISTDIERSRRSRCAARPMHRRKRGAWSAPRAGPCAVHAQACG